MWHKLPRMLGVAMAAGVVACVVETEPRPRRPLLRDMMPRPHGADAALPVEGAGDAGPAVPPAVTLEPAVPAPSEKDRACAIDADCVAVLPNGCCHDGRNIALNKGAVDAYRSSFACPVARPICPMHLVLDRRVAACDVTTHACVLVPEPVAP